MHGRFVNIISRLKRYSGLSWGLCIPLGKGYCHRQATIAFKLRKC